MKIVFYLAHPAHFHLFKNPIRNLRDSHDVLVVYNEKDVLESLIKNSDLNEISEKVRTITNIESELGLKAQFLQKTLGFFIKMLSFKPDLVLGTSIIIALVGKILRFDSVIVNEDDIKVIERTAKIGYPLATAILSPAVCETGRFDRKTIKYDGYHELAYLHPKLFSPKDEVAKQYVDLDSPYYVLRFAKLTAHHDKGKSGLDERLARQIIGVLKKHGDVYITSEINLPRDLKKFQISIDPLDIHHVLAFAKFYIGDSQTMAAEAGVLGIPFIRFNDFVDKISYLAEMEEKYSLGFGIPTSEASRLFDKIDLLLKKDELKEEWAKRRDKMLADKINVADYITNFVSTYPESLERVR